MAPHRDRPGQRPDVELSARLHARSLRLRESSGTETSFPGRGARLSASASSREGLPASAETWRTYREVRIDWRVWSTLQPDEGA